MEKLIRLIREKQVLWFFVLAFMMSWTIWFLSPLIASDDQIRHMIDRIGLFAPAMSAIIISSITGINAQVMPTLRFWVYFCIGFFATYLVSFLSLDFLDIPRNPTIYFLLGAIALMSAMIFASPASKNRGIKRLMRPIKRVRTSIGSWLFALFFLPTVMFVGLFLEMSMGFMVDTTFYEGPWYKYIVVFLAIGIFGGGLNEEPGWRGFALPRLLLQYNPLLTSLMVGILWTAWHAPLHFNGFYGDPTFAWIDLFSRMLWSIPLAVLFTALYFSTKGGLLHAIVFHTSVNTIALYVPLTQISGLFTVGVVLIVVIYVICKYRMWKKRAPMIPFSSPAMIHKTNA